jgi:hypothetical protein
MFLSLPDLNSIYRLRPEIAISCEFLSIINDLGNGAPPSSGAQAPRRMSRRAAAYDPTVRAAA